jgi:hypothetical protein
MATRTARRRINPGRSVSIRSPRLCLSFCKTGTTAGGNTTPHSPPDRWSEYLHLDSQVLASGDLRHVPIQDGVIGSG